MNTPVALIIFNRPENTRRVLNELAKAKPKRLFVVADGPRADHPDDQAKCEQTRKIIGEVDWDCDIKTNFSERNLGCGWRPASGISWVFEQVDRAIILEDDCIPSETFFPYCGELLERYKDDSRVFQISGSTGLPNPHERPNSYYFSRLFSCWGWATWARAWRHYDFRLAAWKSSREIAYLKDLLKYDEAVNYCVSRFDEVANSNGDLDYWDYQWQGCVWLQNGVAIVPRHPLIKNIGFDSDATHTKNVASQWARVEPVNLTFPLIHPTTLVPDLVAEKMFIEQNYLRKRRRPNYAIRLRRTLARRLRALVGAT